MGKKYRVVCYMRIDCEEEGAHMTLEEAKANLEQLEAMQWENIYKIEEVVRMPLRLPMVPWPSKTS
jgi:hypothetical protein